MEKSINSLMQSVLVLGLIPPTDRFTLDASVMPFVRRTGTDSLQLGCYPGEGAEPAG